MGTDFCFFFFKLGVCKDLVSSDFLSSLDMLSLAFSTSSEASVFCFFLAGLASSWKTSVAPFFISFFFFNTFFSLYFFVFNGFISACFLFNGRLFLNWSNFFLRFISRIFHALSSIDIRRSLLDLHLGLFPRIDIRKLFNFSHKEAIHVVSMRIVPPAQVHGWVIPLLPVLGEPFNTKVKTSGNQLDVSLPQNIVYHVLILLGQDGAGRIDKIS